MNAQRKLSLVVCTTAGFILASVLILSTKWDSQSSINTAQVQAAAPAKTTTSVRGEGALQRAAEAAPATPVTLPKMTNTPPARAVIFADEGPADLVIQKALNQQTDLNVAEQPLKDVVGHLASQHHIEIQIDSKALTDNSLTSDMPITISLKGTTLRRALRLMLRPAGLTYTIRDEVLLITTKEAAAEQLRNGVYDVADLVLPIKTGNASALVEIIQSTIQPTNWDTVGGTGSIKYFRTHNRPLLIVSAPQEVHDELSQLLNTMRTARGAIANAEADSSSNVKGTSNYDPYYTPESFDKFAGTGGFFNGGSSGGFGGGGSGGITVNVTGGGGVGGSPTATVHGTANGSNSTPPSSAPKTTTTTEKNK